MQRGTDACQLLRRGVGGPIRLGEWHRYGYRDCALCPFRPVWNSHVNLDSQPPVGTCCMYKVCGMGWVDVYGP